MKRIAAFIQIVALLFQIIAPVIIVWKGLIVFSPVYADTTSFITTWKTDNAGFSSSNQITIPTAGDGYNYNIDWGDGSSDVSVTSSINHTYESAGIYTVSITGSFPRIFFNSNGDREKILSVEQWGNIAWGSMGSAFSGCRNLVINAVDSPNLTGVTDMSYMFYSNTSLNQDISGWDTENVTNMHSTFAGATAFNQDIGGWNTGSVTSMAGMFQGATAFNQDIGGWNVSNVLGMNDMFYGATSFDQDISGWNTGNVRNMSYMFYGANAFTHDITGLNTSSVTDMSGMFGANTTFNQDIGGWNVSSVANMNSMFQGATAFNQDIGGWNVSNVESMASLFYGATSFDQDISGWNTGNVRNMSYMFYGANAFTHDITGLNTSSVTNMTGTFGANTTFNQDIGGWNVSSVTNMTSMFQGATAFNQDIGGWNVSNVESMASLFYGATSFDQDISGWNTGNVTNMSYMFYGANAFTHDITGLNTSNVTNMTGMFGANTTFNQDIGGWDTGNVANMTSMFQGATAFNQDIGGWNVSQVNTMIGMFQGATAFNQDIGMWNTGNVSRMDSLFYGATAFNQNISSWNTSNVTNMAYMFQGAAAFNQDIGGWNTTNVINMASMFQGAAAFNQNISSWNTTNVTNMAGMFQGATAFNQDIGGWNVSNVTTMVGMFQNAIAFEQDIGGWNVSNVTQIDNMFSGVMLTTVNYDALLTGWSQQGVHSELSFDGGYAKYCSQTARDMLTNSPNLWEITDRGLCTSITDVTSSSENTTYGVGDAIDITLSFSGNVTVTGTPELILETGTTDGIAHYSSGSGTNTLHFTYIVNAGENTLDLNYASTSSLHLADGTINDATENDASLILPDPTMAHSLGNNKNIVIDGILPTFIEGTVNSSLLNLIYSKSLDTVSIPSAESFTVSGGHTVTDVQIGGTDNKSVTLTLSPAVIHGESVTINYTPGIAKIQDALGNTAEALVAQAITNDTGLISAPTGTPVLISASDTGISDNDNITRDTTPTFTISCENGGTVQLRESSTVLASGTCPGGNSISLTSSTLSGGVHNIHARQNTGSGYSNNSSSLSITLDTVAPGTPIISSIGDDTVAPYISTTVTPEVALETIAGEYATITGWTCTPYPATSSNVTCSPDSTLNQGTNTLNISLSDAAGNSTTRTATVGVDSILPSISSAIINNATLTLTYSEALDINSIPDINDFVVSIDGSAQTIANIAAGGSNNKIIISLASSINHSDIVVLGYEPGSHPIQDTYENRAVRLIAHSVTNSTAIPSGGGGGGGNSGGGGIGTPSTPVHNTEELKTAELVAPSPPEILKNKTESLILNSAPEGIASQRKFLYRFEEKNIVSLLKNIHGEKITRELFQNQCETNNTQSFYRHCALGLKLNTFSLFKDDILCEGFISKQEQEKNYRFNDTAARKEVIAIALKMKRKGNKNITPLSPKEYKKTFEDIGKKGEANWILPTIETALFYNIITPRKFFEPNRNITRAEAMGVIMKSVCMDIPNLEGRTWQQSLFEKAHNEGLTSKSWSTFEPNRAILRQEIFKIASRAADWAERTGGCDPKPEYCFLPQ